MEKNQRFWTNIVILIGCLLLLTIGYIIGNLTIDKSCNTNPFIYGVKQLNNLNQDKFSCTCYSTKGIQPFSFDEQGINPNQIQVPMVP